MRAAVASIPVSVLGTAPYTQDITTSTLGSYPAVNGGLLAPAGPPKVTQIFSVLFQCSGSRACSQLTAWVTPAGTGIPRVLPANSSKQRSWTARAKNE